MKLLTEVADVASYFDCSDPFIVIRSNQLPIHPTSHRSVKLSSQRAINPSCYQHIDQAFCSSSDPTSHWVSY